MCFAKCTASSLTIMTGSPMLGLVQKFTIYTLTANMYNHANIRRHTLKLFLFSCIVINFCSASVEDARAFLMTGQFTEALPLLESLSENHDAEATCLLAMMYGNGDGVIKNRQKSIQLFTLASDAGNAEASFSLANLSDTPEKYFEIMLTSAKQGHLIAAQQIGRAYYFGKGTEQDLVQAYSWLFSIQLRTPVAVETWTEPLADLDTRLSKAEKRRVMVQAWNFVYMETRTGFYQDDFNRNNPDCRKITEDNVNH